MESKHHPEQGVRSCLGIMELAKQYAFDWPVPKRYGKDPGEAGKHMSLRKWVKTGLGQSGNIKGCESHERGCSVDQ